MKVRDTDIEKTHINKGKYQLQVLRSTVSDKELSDLEVSCYLAIQVLKTCLLDDIYFTPELLFMNILGRELSRKELKPIVAAIDNLIKCKYIVAKKLSNGMYYINKETLFIKNQSFTYISSDDFLTIIRSGRKNKHTLLRYYCAVVGVINSQAEVGGKKGVTAKMPLDYFSALLGRSTKSIMSYNSDLEEMQLIYIARALTNTVSDDGVIYNEMNVYGLYKDKEYIDRANSSYDTDTVNQKRKYAAMYNQMLKGKHYAVDDEAKVMEYIKNKQSKSNKDSNY